MGLEAGGANAHHMIELVSGMFREGWPRRAPELA